MSQTLTELEDLIDKVQALSTDVDAYYTHLSQGTLDQYYKQVLDTAVVDMMRLPMQRMLDKMTPVEDPEDINRSLVKIADILATSFNRSHEQTRTDIIEAVNACPADDIRQAMVLRHNNKLN